MNAVLSFVRRHKVFVLALVLFGAVAVDSLRPASRQVTARTYIGFVHIYQRVARPTLSHWVHCRLQPTCSEYSVQAVRTHGFVGGVFLTVGRLFLCADVSTRAYLQQRKGVNVQTMMATNTAPKPTPTTP
jgi:putative component of membrane protein insertase Oxa1/YidC/SpoIIIJ protein YidD